VWLVWMVWIGCSTHVPAGATIDRPVRYRVEVSAEFGAIQSEQSAEPLQAATMVSMSLLLRLEPTRQFRDGSYARLVHVDGAEMTQASGDEPQAIELDLVGRTVELRTFADGEILDISWGEMVAGQRRYLDVFEVVFPVLSPSAPTISEGQTVRRRIIWPFRNGKLLRWDNIVDAVWVNHGNATMGEMESWKLSYSGPWGTEGKVRRSVPMQTLIAKGTAEGTIHFERRSSDLMAHRFAWERAVVVTGDEGVVTQHQRFEGHLERIR
jgi:hypothetical protein